MSTEAQPPYQHLEARPGSNYRQWPLIEQERERGLAKLRARGLLGPAEE